MVIAHNLAAMNSHRQMGVSISANSKSTEKLSSGYRINRAADDAAGLAISEKMRSQIRGLNMSSKNAQDGISLIQTAEGALQETENMLQRMRELAVQAANGTNTVSDREQLQKEIEQLKDEIDRIGDTTEFNTMKLLNGNLAGPEGVSSSLNTTIGGVIADVKAAKVSVAISTTKFSSLNATNFKVSNDGKLNIDGTTIDLQWSLLDNDQKAILMGKATTENAKKKAEILELVINKGIDNAGASLDHVRVTFNASDGFAIFSGKEGQDSKIAAAGGSGLLSVVLNKAPAGVGSTKLNIEAIAISSSFQMEINGGKYNVKLSATAIAAGDAISAAAKILQDAINKTILAINNNFKAIDGDEGFIRDVVVNATNDGRLVINSESGGIIFNDYDGKDIAKRLGLTGGSTNSGADGGMTLHIGANKDQTMNFGIGDMRVNALGVRSVNIATSPQAEKALENVSKAIDKVSDQRAALGAYQNRLEYTIRNLDTSAENLQAAESRIRDVDMAKEMMEYTKNNILIQASQAMLAQGNQSTQNVLQLLR